MSQKNHTKLGPVQRKLCTISNVCGQLDVGRTTVYQLIADGSLRRVKIGARTLIPQSDVDAFIAGLLDDAAVR
ncbi:helix-turn-helix domain-containing protein [Mycobacterium syngnathidarum]